MSPFDIHSARVLAPDFIIPYISWCILFFCLKCLFDQIEVTERILNRFRRWKKRKIEKWVDRILGIISLVLAGVIIGFLKRPFF